MDTEPSLLQDAKVAIQIGDKLTARRLLLQIVAQKPQHETAWLWLSAIAETPEREQEYLQHVLSINPNNPLALKHLAKFQPVFTPPPTPPPRPPTTIPQYGSASLMPGEQVIYAAQLSPIIFVKPALVAAAAGLLLILMILSSLPLDAPGMKAAVFCCSGFVGLWLIAGILGLINRLIACYTSAFLVTNQRVLVKMGVIRRRSREVLLSRVEGVDVRQSFWGGLLNYGSVIVTGTGGLRTPFPIVNDPLMLRDIINRQLLFYRPPVYF